MATIKIRGRSEALNISDDIAKKIKARKFGNGVPQAEPNELVDLGDWSGEYGRIVEIELSKKPEVDEGKQREREEERKKEEAWYALPADVKAKQLGYFKFMMSGRTGNFKWEPTSEIAAKAIAVQLAWFEKNPRTYNPPSEAYGDLLPPRRGSKSPVTRLVEKVRIVPEEDPLAF